MVIKTEYYKNFLHPDIATALYAYLKYDIDWEDGIPSRRHGFTRKAKGMDMNEIFLGNNSLKDILINVFQSLKIDSAYGIYLNYYRDGNDFTPSHTHKNTKQLIISLGETRKLDVGSKTYDMNNGDVIVFGSSAHGIKKEPEVKEGRISIAVFIPV